MLDIGESVNTVIRILVPYDASQMFEDVCEATAIEKSSWDAVKGLVR